MKKIPVLAALAAMLCACAPDSSLPYTVYKIDNGVYRIEDSNASNPAGESFDAEGNKKVYANSSIGESLAVKGDKVSAWVGRQNAREAHCYTLEASGNVNASTSSSEGGE